MISLAFSGPLQASVVPGHIELASGESAHDQVGVPVVRQKNLLELKPRLPISHLGLSPVR